MSRSAVVLFSGGLDSQLAVRVLQSQGVAACALNFQTSFTRGSELAERAARQLGVPLTTITAGDDYLALVRSPRFGYGQGANPCLDCRIYLLRRAHQFMEQSGADFLATGDIVGQRLMGQKRRDLDVIAYHSGCEDLLLRPLCAQRLPPTLPEREGWVDRSQLYNFSGTGRRKLIALARRLGLVEIPPQTTGCLLVEKHFAAKVHELVQLDSAASAWDFELLQIGRHIHGDDGAKIILGRSAAENDALAELHARAATGDAILLTPENFRGPSALVVKDATPDRIAQAARLIASHTRDPRAVTGTIALRQTNGAVQIITVSTCATMPLPAN